MEFPIHRKTFRWLWYNIWGQLWLNFFRIYEKVSKKTINFAANLKFIYCDDVIRDGFSKTSPKWWRRRVFNNHFMEMKKHYQVRTRLSNASVHCVPREMISNGLWISTAKSVKQHSSCRLLSASLFKLYFQQTSEYSIERFHFSILNTFSWKLYLFTSIVPSNECAKIKHLVWYSERFKGQVNGSVTYDYLAMHSI